MKIRIKKIPQQPNINAYGGLLDAVNNLFALGGDIQSNGTDYSVGKVYNVSEAEANRLKAMGYEFTVIS